MSSVSSVGAAQEVPVAPSMDGRHPQFPRLPAFIDGRMVAHVPPKNQFREPKKIPYGVPVTQPGSPSWSSCEYSSTPSILSIETEVSYPWEITVADFMNDVQVRQYCRMASAQRSSTPTAEREGNSSHSATGGSSVGAGSSPSSSSSSGRSSSERSSSSAGTSTSTPTANSSSGRSARSQRRAHGLARTEIVAEGSVFPGAPERSDPQDGPGSHFPNPRVVRSLKRSALEKQYLLPAGYKIVFPEPDATVNIPPTNCVAVYRAALEYGVRFPLHPVIVDILSKYEVALAQVVPTS